MKDEPVPLSAKEPRARFRELGRKIMSASKDEIDKRDKKWHAAKRRRKPKR